MDVQGALHRIASCHPLRAGVGVHLSAPNQVHAVVLYRTDAAVRALHFCWMKDWKDEVVQEDYLWTPLPLDSSEARYFAIYCSEVASNRLLDDVPFAFRHDARTRFELSVARVVFGDDAHGFTCATFILSLLGTIGFVPLDASTWQQRGCDQLWQRGILRLLKRTHPSEDLRRQEQEIGAVRFRPEEVVGCCATPTRTAFPEALVRGRAVLAALGAEHLACCFDL